MEYVLGIFSVYTAVRTVSYGVWNIREKNIVGGVSVFFWAVAVLGLAAYTILKLG